MRLWHKSLIGILPRQQLTGQWRECCLLAKNISEKGTPNHVLVNRIMDYPIEHFYVYSRVVYLTMRTRRYKADWNKFAKYLDLGPALPGLQVKDLFPDWHNDRYLVQCFNNLQEKYDCGAITEAAWEPILNFFFIRKVEELCPLKANASSEA